MVSLPPALINSVQEQRAVLFLGAGASKGAIHPRSSNVPLGDALRDAICDKFLEGRLKNLSLMAVAAMTASEIGLTHLQKYIREVFVEFQPAPFHKLIPTFRWRAIATTNFDLIIERAYDSNTALQNLIKSVKDGDLFDTRQAEASDPLGFFKLHGCIDHYTDTEIPLILGQEQYASYASHRTRFYSRLRDYAFENPIIFCGYSISDAHIQTLLFDLTNKDIKRPMYYHISPGISDIETRYWAGNQVTCIPTTLQGFLEELDKKISTTARQLRRLNKPGQLPIASHYQVANATESDELQWYINKDVIYAHRALVAAPQSPTEFYKGYDTGFGCIVQDLDIRRPVTDSIIVDTVLNDEGTRKFGELFLVKAPAGHGKTVAIKRVAWEASASYDKIALYVDSAAGLRLEPIEEIIALTGKRVFLFVDRVALLRTELQKLLTSCRSRKIPVTVIGAERENEWNIYCDALEPFVIQDFTIGYLSRSEVVELLQKLENHRALGLLVDRSPEERTDAFMNRANRQLLVALHETTMGVPFEKIVLDEYDRIKPRGAQLLYLQICALHQFGAPVRAGLISRISQINFDQFQKNFLKPLADVVLVENDEHSGGDNYYKSRHQHVAELVFNQALSSEEERYDLLASLIASMNIDYTSDRETFSRIIRGRNLSTMFSNINLGRLVYDRAEEIAIGDSFVLHQRAVFELQHRDGSLDAAEAAATQASKLNPNNRGIKHTLAEVARRQALTTADPLRKQSYRRTARTMVSGDLGHLTQYDMGTRAKVAIDELREVVNRSASNGPNIDSGLVDAIKEAESTITRARASFPESPELLAIESDLHDVLNNAPKAIVALEKAFKLNPRQDWLAIRLAKRNETEGNAPKAIEVMDRCLKENPDSRLAHLHIAHLLARNSADHKVVLEHLRQSFSAGDNNFEGQFWYARALFIDNRISDSQSVFESLNERAPGRFRTDASAIVENSTGQKISYQGTVKRKEEGYAFIGLIDFSLDIFASRGESVKSIWDKLRSGSQVSCNVAFNRRGPQAINVVDKRT